MAQVTWVISGRINVEENEVNGSGQTMIRPLANAEVEVLASNFGKYASWGTVRTDSDGDFTLRNEKDRSKRKIKVKVRFADSELEINTGALANAADFLSPAIEVFEHANEVEGPNINIGTRTFRAGGPGELGDRDNRRRAIAWYVGKRLINTLEDKDPYFAFKSKVKIIYPANVVSGQCYANGLTRSVYIHSTNSKDLWNVQVVLHELMHLWNYDHNHGTANWFGAVFCPPDFNTHAQAERRPIAFHEGFAEFAAWELLRELWGDEPDSGRARQLPYTRYALVHDLHLDTIDEVEQNDEGVFRALCVLAARALYAKRFGDKHTRLANDPHPDAVEIGGLNCPENPRVTIWDVLKVFQANPGAGYSTEWQVGSNDYGVRRFFERAADILPNLDEATKDLMLSLIDPNSREEPQSRCQERTWQVSQDRVVSVGDLNTLQGTLNRPRP
jgi:hypothetical protein